MTKGWRLQGISNPLPQLVREQRDGASYTADTGVLHSLLCQVQSEEQIRG